jgi:hypothetical protein
MNRSCIVIALLVRCMSGDFWWALGQVLQGVMEVDDIIK